MRELSQDPRKRAAEEKCLADIATHDVHVLKVFGDAAWPEFAYTIGLYETFAHPEIIVVGLPGDSAHPILNEVRDLVRGGARFRAGDESGQVLDGHAVTFRPLSDAQRDAHFGWAGWFYDGRSYPTLQMIFPDASGRWPWDSEATESFRQQQPILESAPLPPWAQATG